MTTRIKLRSDSAANWATAEAAGEGKLLRGEIGVASLVVSGGTSTVIGRIGVDASQQVAFSECPIVFYGTWQSGVAGPVFSKPIVYQEPSQTPPNGSVVAWDSSLGRWVVDTEVLSLAAYPQANGSVAWDQAQGKFVVGAAVSAVGIDGGSYTA